MYVKNINAFFLRIDVFAGARGHRNSQGDDNVYPRVWSSLPAGGKCVEFSGHYRIAFVLWRPERLRQTRWREAGEGVARM